MEIKKEKIRCKVTGEILIILEKYEITRYDLEFILENIEANYKHNGILKKGVHINKN